MIGNPLKKGDDGAEVRPILIGESLLALPGAWLSHMTSPKLKRTLGTSQFGVGIPSGPESMAALCSALLFFFG